MVFPWFSYGFPLDLRIPHYLAAHPIRIFEEFIVLDVDEDGGHAAPGSRGAVWSYGILLVVGGWLLVYRLVYSDE